MVKFAMRPLHSFTICLWAIFVIASLEVNYPPMFGTAANGSRGPVSIPQGSQQAPVVLTASRMDSHSVDLHWINPQGDKGIAGYAIYRNGQKLGDEGVSGGPYFRDSHVAPLQTYTYSVAAFDKAGNHSPQSQSITIRTLATGSGNKYTIAPSDAPAAIYGILDNAGCGDTVSIEPGTYTVASGHAAMIYIKDKHCNEANPYVVRASDPNSPPIFDYSGYPLDGGENPVPNHWTPWESDFYRGAWQIQTSSYVILDGLHIKGAEGFNVESVAGVRFVATDHFTIRHSFLERNYDGLEGYGTNTVVEYNTFLANGKPGVDQQHQFYDMGGDDLTLRYNYFNDGGCQDCGQNFHSRSWHSHVYGNWFQDGSDYEWDMMTPPVNLPAPYDRTMVQEFFGNVVVTSQHPRNNTKVFTFFADSSGMPTGKMKLDAEWNTFWIRSEAGILSNYSLFQISNYKTGPNKIAEIDLHFANNIVHFGGGSFWRSSKPQLFILMDSGPWSVAGTSNWFDSFLGNPCLPASRASGGSCSLANSNSSSTPPFRSASALDLRPSLASHPFGIADTRQPLKSPNQQFPAGPRYVTPRTSFDDIGALQYFPSSDSKSGAHQLSVFPRLLIPAVH